MQKTVTIVLLLAVAILGLSQCEGSYIDPGVLEMMGGGSGDNGGNGGGGGGGNPTSLVGTWIDGNSFAYYFNPTTVSSMQLIQYDPNYTFTYSYDPAKGEGRIPAIGQWVCDILPANPPSVNKIRLEFSSNSIILTKAY